MSALASRHRSSRAAAGAAAFGLASVTAVGLGAALLSVLASGQGCGTAQSGASPATSSEIPAVMLADYERVGRAYDLPWEVLAGIGQEECRQGLDPDPSCQIRPGQRGPGVANYAGASGPMQIGIGGAAGDEYEQLRAYLPAAERELGPHDPLVAVQLAALVLIRDKGAPLGAAIDAYWPYVRAYNGTGPAADAYASRVIADAHRYQAGVVLAATDCPAAAPGSYVNPFARASGLTPQRIDMGVDYDGRGPILALGDARITYASADDPGWAYCGAAGAITLQLLDGPDQGRYVYIAEGLRPLVSAGRQVSAGQQIALFAGSGCIEIGWSAISDGAAPEAAALGQQAQGAGEDPGSNRTYCGQSMSDLLASLGAPPGLGEGKAIVGDRC